MQYYRYLRYIIRHKWFVFVECLKYGLIWRGFAHDMSKLLPSEFFPYCEFFYGKCSDHWRVRADFDFAWLLHQNRNKHHWQFWILPEDDGGTKLIEMPRKYALEMIADWKGAGRAIHGAAADPLKWYLKNKDTIQLNIRTRALVEYELQERGKC